MYNDPQQSDPTEYQRPIEPTQASYRNPYETPNPYYGDVPPPPPPPSLKQRHTGLSVVFARKDTMYQITREELDE